MDLMAIRRSLMMGAKEEPKYIQDGLIFFLDGLRTGPSANKWVDVIGKKEFVLENCQKQSNGVYFSGNNSGGSFDGVIGSGYDNDTIECVITRQSSIKQAFFAQKPPYLAVWQAANSNFYFLGNGVLNPGVNISESIKK